MKRIGLFCSNAQRETIEEALAPNFIDFRDANCVPIDSALSAWQAAGMDVVVIDDASCVDKYEEEEIIINWARSALSGAARIIFISDPEREVDDPFFFQLVSVADVKDILLSTIGHSITQTLPYRIDTPTRIQEVSYWKTDDKRKLIRASEKRGIAGTLARRRIKKEREKILEEARSINTQDNKGDETMPEDTIKENVTTQDTEEEKEDLSCPNCGAVIAPNQVFCGFCAFKINDAEEDSLETDTSSPKQSSNEEVAVSHIVEQVLADDSFGKSEDTTEDTAKIDNQPSIVTEEDSHFLEEQEDDGAEQEPSSKTDSNALPFSPFIQELGLREDVEEPNLDPQALTAPTAQHIIAVAATRSGIGCTHLTCALALELARLACRVSVAIYNPETFHAMKGLLAPKESREDFFSFHGVDFYKYFSQREYSDRYNTVVVDCGYVEDPSADINGPAHLFERAEKRVMICSGAPWDLMDAIDVIQKRSKASLRSIEWRTYSAPKSISESLGQAIAKQLGQEGPVAVNYVPYRPALFVGDRPYYSHYKSILGSIVAELPSIPSDPID